HIPASTRLAGEHFIDETTLDIRVTHLPPDQVARSGLLTFDKVIGRVVKNDHDPGSGFTDKDLLPRENPRVADAAVTANDRGIGWWSKRVNDKAIREFTEAIRIDPNYLAPRSNRGNAWMDLKEYDKAIRDFTE